MMSLIPTGTPWSGADRSPGRDAASRSRACARAPSRIDGRPRRGAGRPWPRSGPGRRPTSARRGDAPAPDGGDGLDDPEVGRLRCGHASDSVRADVSRRDVSGPAEDEVAAGDERAQLRRSWPARGVWLNPQSGTSASRSGGTPAASTAVDPLGDLVGRFEVGVLHVDDARRPRRARPRRSRRGSPTSAISRFANSRTSSSTRKPEHRVEHRPVRPPRQRPAQVVPEAQVRPEPDAADDRLDRRVEEGREVGRGVGVDRRRRVVDLDEGRAGRDQPVELGPQDRHERLGRVVAMRVDLARAVRQPARQRVRPRDRDLQRPRRLRGRVAVLPDDAEAVRRGDRLEHLEPVLLVVPAGPSRRAGGSGRTPVRCW